jgi:hypothetical protein
MLPARRAGIMDMWNALTVSDDAKAKSMNGGLKTVYEGPRGFGRRNRYAH